MSSRNVIDLRKGAARPAQPPLDLPSRPERPARRVSPVRARRRRTRLVIALFSLIIIAGAAYGISWASYLPQYSVSAVTVDGANIVPAKLIYDYVESRLYAGTRPFLSKDNIFLYNPGALEREIVGFFPRIASATVTRSSLLATAVTVTVKERQPFALWCADAAQADCYEMDGTGFIFAQVPPSIASDATTTAGQQYVFQGGIGTSVSTTANQSPIGRTFVGAHMPGIIALLQMLGQAGFTPAGAAVENDQDFRVPLAQGFYIKASFGEDPENIVSNLQLVLSSDALAGKENQLEYVDLRFGDRVYYKLQGAAVTQTQPS
jgi:cell division septal protein FtsQ